MGIRSFIPGTTAHSAKHHQKYLRKKLGGADALLLVEWADGKLTELSAVVKPEMDGWYQAENGLMFAPAGEGVDPVDWHGVPVVRCHASVACPISTTAALHSEFDEEVEYEVVEDNEGNLQKVVKYEPTEDPRETAPQNGQNGNGETAADGGMVVRQEKEFDARPPAPAVGWSFGTDQVKQRAPYPISPNMLRRAVEYGKESARGDGTAIKYLIIGALGMLGIIVFLAVVGTALMNFLGGGGGGGGSAQSATNLGLLLLAGGGPWLRERIAASLGGE